MKFHGHEFKKDWRLHHRKGVDYFRCINCGLVAYMGFNRDLIISSGNHTYQYEIPARTLIKVENENRCEDIIIREIIE